MTSEHENIFAELTAPGRGGISTIALLGPRAAAALRAAFRPRRADLASTVPPPGRVVYGHMIDSNGDVIDEVLVHAATAPAGADAPVAFEVHCHGGPAPVLAIADRLASLGLQRVDWPDFLTARASRLHQSAITADADGLLPHLLTLRAAAFVSGQGGGLLADSLRRLIAHVSDGRTADTRDSIKGLLDAWESVGRHIERPPRIAILGAANAGKSSLMNRLVGTDRSIVTELPGTTRDVVTEIASLDGLPVVLADTAGLRDSDDPVEQLGIERARAEALRADILLYLADLSESGSVDRARSFAADTPRSLLVGTKTDLLSPTAAADAEHSVDVATSAVTGQGIPQLIARIIDALAFRWPAPDEPVPFTSRHADLLRQADAALARDDTTSALSALHHCL